MEGRYQRRVIRMILNPGKFILRQFLDTPQARHLICVTERECDTGRASARGPAYPVDVIFGILR